MSLRKLYESQARAIPKIHVAQWVFLHLDGLKLS